jgi:HD-GYP domain-containing protein (c-di-GMP phosphodiesterase class II)
VVSIITKDAGARFDKKVVDAFIRALPRILVRLKKPGEFIGTEEDLEFLKEYC